MKITPALEQEILSVMEDYWNSYFEGNLEKWASYLPDHYRNIGTTQEEVWDNKKQIVEYTQRVFDQMVGMADFRNKTAQVIPYDPHVMVHELGDLFVKAEEDWVYYAPFRLTSLLEKTEEGWKILHQHGSFPDLKAAEGEAFGLDAVKAENERLKKAVEERTLELELQKKELEIEASLERVRSKSLAMHQTSELQSVIHTVHEELLKLGLSIYGGSFIVINSEIDQELKCWGAGGTADTSDEVHIPRFEKPFYLNLLESIKKREGFFTEEFSREEKIEFFNFLFTKEPWSSLSSQEKKQTLEAKGGYTRSCMVSEHTSIFIINHEGIPFSEADNAILKRFGKVFEQAFSRFLDLQKAEAQARKAQIEASLERVRARTMAMHDSIELEEVAVLMYKEFLTLGYQSIHQCGYAIIREDEHLQEMWLSQFDGNRMSHFSLPLKSDALLNERYQVWKSGLPKFYQKVTKSAFLKHLQNVKAGINPQQVERARKSMPDPIHFYNAHFNHGYLHIVANAQLSMDEEAILSRFAKVFDQTYTRFLDLQKAESQARKAQIEASLERVRAHAMGLRQSNELEKIIEVIFEELQKLGLAAWECSIFFRNGNSRVFTVWGRDSTGDSILNQYQFPFLDHPILNAVLEDFERQVPYREILLEGEEIKSYGDLIFSETVFKDSSPEYKDSFYSLEKMYAGQAMFKYGFLEAVGIEPLPGDFQEVLQRFAQVIDLAYTRFLDLQKAEAQAREAQIEAALERVRSRSMGMQKSEELQAVIKLVYDQLIHLDIHLDHAGFVVDYVPFGNWTFWIADQHEIPSKISHPYFDSIWAKQFNEAKQQSKAFFETLLDFEEKNRFYEELLSYIPDLPKVSREFYMTCPGLAATTVLFEDVSLYMENFEGKPYTEEEIKILIRFGNVFQQTYTRFLDLKKAENQAREAKIEASLERIRARTMAMQSSDELLPTSSFILKELRSLGQGDDQGLLGVSLIDEGKNQFISYISDSGGPVMTDQLALPLDHHPLIQELYQAWKKAKESKTAPQFLSRTLPKDKFQEWVNQLVSYNKGEHPDALVPNAVLELTQLNLPQWTFEDAFYKQGILFYQNINPISDEFRDILVRFAKVFEQTYTRFLDLQTAEEQAREAEIQLALERVRARTMAMRDSRELAEVVSELFRQMESLGFAKFGCALVLVNEENGKLNFWLTTHTNRILPEPYSLEYSEHKISQRIFDSYKNQEKKFTLELRDEEKREYDNWMFSNTELGGLPNNIKEEVLSKNYVMFSFASMKYGLLYAMDHEPISEELQGIVERFAKVFEQTYTRFLDLQKAEAQAREAQIEAALEKVRSRSLAMHRSDELKEVVRVLFERLNELQVPVNAVGISINIAGSKDLDNYTCGLVKSDISINNYRLPYFDHIIANDFFEAREKQLEFFVGNYSKQEKDSFYEYVIEHTGLKNELTEDIKQFIFQSPSYSVAVVTTTHTMITLNDFEGKSLSNGEIDILKRFAKVFEQTYTRFLDLQKAEAQAREAQIELSLEKIRSKVSSMQESTELLDIMVSIRSEFVSLGHEAEYFWYMRWLPEKYEKAMTSGDGSQVGMIMTLPRHIHGDIPLVADWEKGQEPTLVFPMDVETAIVYVDKMISLGDFELVDPHAPTLEDIRHIGGLTFVMARTSQGEIGYSLSGEVPNPPEEAVKTLARFAGVFDLAYARFEDLKKAERDLVAIKEAKQKAEEALAELKSAQAQLIQSEKMASLGELTAGIAHEIQNPLNFVNNFSEVSAELLDELSEELKKGDLEEADFILSDLKDNLTKINHHGKRAGSIVKGMLEHSRKSEGKKEPVDLNALADECLKLGFHGLRAKDKTFSADFKANLAQDLPEISIVRQDIGRVLLNLINNAFYAVHDFGKTQNSDFKPIVSISTRQVGNQLEISVSDNGKGIPEHILDKIFQPFFTTKPTGEGTGLGLSLSYDIIKAHGGELTAQNLPEGGAQFKITIPIV